MQGGSQWTPHIPIFTDLYSKVFASEFRSDQQVIWLFVNRDQFGHDELVELKLNCIQGATVQGRYNNIRCKILKVLLAFHNFE